MKILDLMKKYCERLFESDEPESMAMYQALLPAVIRCETKVGDTIECMAADLVQEVANFMHAELELPELEFPGEQYSFVVENTIEFIIKSILDARKE